MSEESIGKGLRQAEESSPHLPCLVTVDTETTLGVVLF